MDSRNIAVLALALSLTNATGARTQSRELEDTDDRARRSSDLVQDAFIGSEPHDEDRVTTGIQEESGNYFVNFSNKNGDFQVVPSINENGQMNSSIGKCKCSLAGGMVPPGPGGSSCSRTNCEDGTVCGTTAGQGGNSCGFYTDPKPSAGPEPANP